MVWKLRALLHFQPGTQNQSILQAKFMEPPGVRISHFQAEVPLIELTGTGKPSTWCCWKEGYPNTSEEATLSHSYPACTSDPLSTLRHPEMVTLWIPTAAPLALSLLVGFSYYKTSAGNWRAEEKPRYLPLGWLPIRSLVAYGSVFETRASGRQMLSYYNPLYPCPC